MSQEPRSDGAKWYLTEPRRLEFESRVATRLQLPGGAHAVVLDRTCFYPTSGGQPHDSGTLNDVPVLEVHEDAIGRVVHRLAGELEGTNVRGVVDAQRRLDHTQQHSGQHLLSATCVRLIDRETASFHLGADTCSIDLPGPALAPAEMRDIECQANAVVWEGRVVHVRLFAADDCRRLRKPPPGDLDTVRVIEIDDWDLSPCCGTHVARTNEIGCIKLLRQERVRDTTRLHFVCGWRAVDEAERMLQRQEALVRELTCHPDELAGRVESLMRDIRCLRKEGDTARGELAVLRARSWLHDAPQLGGRPVVVRALEDPAALRATADALVECGAVAVLGAAGERAQFLFVCSEDAALDLRPALRAACQEVGGRGGGPPHRVQGAGPERSALARALEAARQTLFGADL